MRPLIAGQNVPNLYAPTTTLSAAPSSGISRALVTPLSGGIQFLDATGALVTPAATGGTGALALTVTDTNNTSVVNVLSLNHTLSSGSPSAGIGTGIIFSAQTAVGTTKGADIFMTFTDVDTGTQDATLTSALRVAGANVNATVLSAPTAGTNVLTAAGAADANLAIRSAGTGLASLQGSGGANVVAVSTVAATSRLGFFNTTPAVQGAAVPDPAGGATVDAEARAAIVLILARLRTPGFIAT